MDTQADIILKSHCIFTATEDSPFEGYIAITHNKISAVSKGNVRQEFLGATTEIYDFGEYTISPGFSDVHCFFTGYVRQFAGADLSKAETAHKVIQTIKDYAASLPETKTILGHGWLSDIIQSTEFTSLETMFDKRPVVLFAMNNDTCWMNQAAIDIYQFTPSTCYSEAYWRLLRDILNDRDFIIPEFCAYQKMMNSRGITSVKEMGFDDFYGFTTLIKELENSKKLSLRFHFMSQPVGENININYGKKMRDLFTGSFVHFSGYNQMTDGSISQLCGLLKKPYNCAPHITCAQTINWEKIRKETYEADAAGFRFSLHAQGDAAIAKVVDIYEKCNRDTNGHLVNRHSMTDIEFSDPEDLKRMGRLGVIAEIYPQIQSITNRKDKITMINEKIGPDRSIYYWNRRAMIENGIVISCGTDLPLVIDDIPASIYYGVGGYFPEGGEPLNIQNMLTTRELMTAWTKGGAYNLYREKELGTLEVGKLADITVLDGNVFNTDMQDIRNIKVAMTIVDGKIVYKKNA